MLEVLGWPRHGLGELRARGIPVIARFRPCRHTSRQGFLARADCFPRNPFAADPGAGEWLLTDGRIVSLRQMACEIAAPFRKSIRAVTDAAGCEHLFAVFDGRARSLMDFPDRPPRYEDVGRIIDWNRRSTRKLPRSAYERVIHHVLEHRRIRVNGVTYTPERMLGWYEIAFRETRTGRRRVFNLTTGCACVLIPLQRRRFKSALVFGPVVQDGGVEIRAAWPNQRVDFRIYHHLRECGGIV